MTGMSNRERCKKYREENKEKIQEYSKKYSEENKQILQESKGLLWKKQGKNSRKE